MLRWVRRTRLEAQAEGSKRFHCERSDSQSERNGSGRLERGSEGPVSSFDELTMRAALLQQGRSGAVSMRRKPFVNGAWDHPKGIDSPPAVIAVGFRQLELRLGQLPEFHCNPVRQFLAMFERRDDPSGRIVPRAEPPHSVLRQSRPVRALRITPWCEAFLIREPQIHQDLHPPLPISGKNRRKDDRAALQRRRPLRSAKNKPSLGESVDPEHFALALINQSRNFWRRAVLFQCALGGRPVVP